MAQIPKNGPCPCGSGRKYKKCCMPHTQSVHQEPEHEGALRFACPHCRSIRASAAPAFLEGSLDITIDELDELSNSVLDLIDAGKFQEAESVCRELRDRYPDQVDGIERMAGVYEARGEKKKAAEYYLMTAEFMRTHPGFDKESIEWALAKAEQLTP